MGRVAGNEDPDQLYRYLGARADLAEQQAAAESEDPAEIEARARERRLLRLLIAMVLLIVGGGFLISFVGLVLMGGGGGH